MATKTVIINSRETVMPQNEITVLFFLNSDTINRAVVNIKNPSPSSPVTETIGNICGNVNEEAPVKHHGNPISPTDRNNSMPTHKTGIDSKATVPPNRFLIIL